MKLGITRDTARARERRALEGLAGHQPLRSRALWVERCVVPAVLVVGVLGVIAGFFVVRAVDDASGRRDQRITAITITTAQLDLTHQTAAGAWVADVTWADEAGAVHRGHVSVPGDVPVGTPVPARLADNGVVRSAPDAAFDVWGLAVASCLGIGLVLLALALIVKELLAGVAHRLRLASWQAAWAHWPPTVHNHEEL